MSKPITTGVGISTLNFEQRIKLVSEEITRRKHESNPANPHHFTAHLWVSWLKRNVLEVE